MSKVCSICGQEKPIEQFYQSKNTCDGKSTYCKKCQIAKATISRKKRAYEAAYIESFAADVKVTHEKVADLVKHIIRDLSDEMSDLIKYVELKPAMKRALISEIESTCLIKSSQYVDQLSNISFSNEPPATGIRDVDEE